METYTISLDKARRLTTYHLAHQKDYDTLAIFLINKHGAIAETNDVSIGIFGFDPEELIGTFYGRFLTVLNETTDRGEFMRYADPVIRCLLKQECNLTIKGALHNGRGKTFSFRGSVSPVQDEGATRGALLILRPYKVCEAERAPGADDSPYPLLKISV